MNAENLSILFRNYIDKFDFLNQKPDPNESYKWTAIEQVQKCWDLSADNLAEMIKAAFSASYNLINNRIVQPVSGLVALAKVEPDAVRLELEKLLMADDGDIDARQGRILDFVDACNGMLEKHHKGKWKYAQDVRSTIAYLAMIKPSENYLFKAMTAHYFAKYMEFGGDIGAGQTFKLRNYYAMCDQLVMAIEQNPELLMVDAGRKPTWKDPSHHVLAYDLIYCFGVHGLKNGMQEPIISKAHKSKSASVQQHAYRKEIAEKLQREIDEIQDQIDTLIQEIDKFPAHDFTGKAIKTKAFGTVEIICHEGRYLTFLSGGKERRFLLPGCVAEGFLIPEDQNIIQRYTAEKSLMEKIDQLEKQQHTKVIELRKYQD